MIPKADVSYDYPGPRTFASQSSVPHIRPLGERDLMKRLMLVIFPRLSLPQEVLRPDTFAAIMRASTSVGEVGAAWITALAQVRAWQICGDL